MVKKRNKLVDYFQEKNIPFMIYYPIPMHMRPAYKKYSNKNIDLINSIKLSKTVISLPIHAYLTSTEKEYILDHLKKVRKFL